MMNICDHLQCPFNDKKRGCQRFTTSWHCPVGGEREKKGRNRAITPNEYWLFAEANADIDINQLRLMLHAEVLDDPVSKAHALAQSDRWDEIQSLHFC